MAKKRELPIGVSNALIEIERCAQFGLAQQKDAGTMLEVIIEMAKQGLARLREERSPERRKA